MKYIEIIKSNKGLTLVETLAILIITVIIFGLISSIMMNTVNESNRQKSEAEYLANARLVLKSITKDIRKSYELKVVNGNELELTSNGGTKLIYLFDNSKLIKKQGTEQVIADELGCVHFVEKVESKSLEILTSSNPDIEDCTTESKYIESTIIRLRNE